MRRAVGERWRETAGEPGRAVAHAVEEGRGGDAAPLGLALQVLYAEGAEGVQLLRDARVRLEAWVGKAGLSAAAAGAWARASAALLDRLEERDREGAAALLARGDELLAELGAAAEAARSDRLPAGARARRAHFAELLRAAVERGAAPGPICWPPSTPSATTGGSTTLSGRAPRWRCASCAGSRRQTMRRRAPASPPAPAPTP